MMYSKHVREMSHWRCKIVLRCSRLTLNPFRRRVEYGLISDPLSEISEEDLSSTIRQIRQDIPYSGVSMMWGSLRSRGVKVSRERIRSALQSIDPLSRALRWPAGLTRRQPYSVAGPNSLWHIGKYHNYCTIVLVNIVMPSDYTLA